MTFKSRGVPGRQDVRRVLRGGALHHDLVNVRTPNRNDNLPAYRYHDNGFRVAVSV